MKLAVILLAMNFFFVSVAAACSNVSDCSDILCPQVIGSDTIKCSPDGQCYCGGICGDNYCDSYEKNSGACMQDCNGEMYDENFNLMLGIAVLIIVIFVGILAVILL